MGCGGGGGGAGAGGMGGCSHGSKLVSVQGTKLVGQSLFFSPPRPALPQRLFNTILFGSFLISMESILLPFEADRGRGMVWGAGGVLAR